MLRAGTLLLPGQWGEGERIPFPLFGSHLFEILQQVGHFLRTRLKLGHWWGLPAGDLPDQIEFGFAIGHSVQVGPDLTIGNGCVTPGTVHLKDGGTLKRVAREG